MGYKGANLWRGMGQRPISVLDRLQPAAHRVVRPGVEEAFGSTRVAIAPEFLEGFLDAPSAAGLED